MREVAPPPANDTAPPPGDGNVVPLRPPISEAPPQLLPEELDMTATGNGGPAVFSGSRKGGGRGARTDNRPPSRIPKGFDEGDLKPPQRRIPGLPTPEEDEVIRRYIEWLAQLRARWVRFRQANERIPPDQRQLQSARSALETVNRRLEEIETEALGQTEGELLEHLAPFTRERELLNADQGLSATLTGTRLPCLAVQRAPSNLRGMDFTDIETAIGRPPDHIAPPGQPRPGAAQTSHGSVWWEFEDGSLLVVDAPRRLGKRPVSADLPHAELHGPRGERLDNQGIQVPKQTIATHMTITDHHNRDLLSLPWVVSPSRKWRAESAEREHGEGDDGFL